jgi:CDP-diacylglycerol--glycerol-3-phosphate 3-phosphatidyltransferase
MNLPNKLTISRILMIPIFMIAAAINSKYSSLYAVLIFLLAVSTDSLDGHIARKRQQITNFGKFLDPLADKLLVTAALIILVEKTILPGWIATVIISREFIVTGIRLIAAADGRVIAASIWGKIKTVTQIVAIVIAFLNDHVLLSSAFKNIDSYFVYIDWFTYIAIALAVIATIFSCIDYLVKNKDVLSTENIK